VAALFNQTPGPGAGAFLRADEAHMFEPHFDRYV
jgi:hypothetical protein